MILKYLKSAKKIQAINTVEKKTIPMENKMSHFDIGLKKVLICEGGYVFDPDDRGGETYRGVARKFHGEWKGWDEIDLIKENRPIKFNEIIKSQALDMEIAKFYKKKFYKANWNKLQVETVATEIMEAYVNYGSFVFKLVQRALVKIGIVVGVDGKYGKQTEGALLEMSNVQSMAFLDAFDEVRITYIDAIIAHRPKNAKFRKGWLKRILKR